jgi:sulfur carrier protein
MTLFVLLNGERRELATGATVADVLEAVSATPDGRGVAVAVEGEVVPRGAWPRTVLTEGARVEIVAAVQGG